MLTKIDVYKVLCECHNNHTLTLHREGGVGGIETL